MRKIRVGIIGASSSGGWALYGHLPALRMLPQYAVTAVCATNQEHADEVARRHGVPHAFDRPKALVTHPEVDLVVVSVKAPEHDALVRAAIDAGKDVFCEWPLGTSTAQAAALAKRAEAAKVRTVIGLQRRLSPGVRYLRDLLAEGYVGTLRSVTLHAAIPMMGARRKAREAYTADVENGANTFSIFAAHYLDTLFSAVGPLRDVAGIVARQFNETTLVDTDEVIPVTAPDQVLIDGTLESGAVVSAHFESGKRSGGGIFFHFTGTEGDLLLSENLQLSGTQQEEDSFEPLPAPSHYAWLPRGELGPDAHDVGHVYAAYARDVAEGTRLAPDFSEAMKLHRLLDVIARASATGRRQAWTESL
ncbi:Gfo/Idh/MocA family protein [Myxococcus sp. 1LA]